ncbi:MAG: SDR family NAD(P)-dependent oxidoreductase [Clostridiales bacterium]|jgi:NAD(P)-dependent dehydrogenase (short-subunit alcohol dehydrogenase family)/rhamnose utilization protein RhaD (predicted bifunctional aldolase and dehydrogenase)|nr:SDR family NAD(P)-dependent oxidoreductase [Clostridiales bacterium]
MSLQILTEMSNKYGADEAYVLAGGGNTSFKDGGVMYVKSSGTRLSDIRPEQFVRMDMAKLTAMLDKQYPAQDDAREAAALADMFAARLPGEEAKRPSVEAILHGLFPYKYVLHVHPTLVNGLTCGADGRRVCAELFGEAAVWIGLVKPGYILSAVCKDIFAERLAKTGEYPKIAIMQNHGIFAAADTVEEIDGIIGDVMARLDAHVKNRPDFAPVDVDDSKLWEILPALRMLYSNEGKSAAVFCTNRTAMRFVADNARFAALIKPFTPDHIVYCKDEPLFIKPDADIAGAFAQYRAKKGFAPKIVAIQGLGFAALGASKKEAETAKLLFLDAIKIAVYAESFGGILPLPDDFTDFILNWEIEQYRSAAAFSAGAARRLEGKIAIVTGSAQGFGKGIARELANQGAYVVVADINAEGAEACAAELNHINTEYCAIGAHVDVTDEDSVEQMVLDTLKAFGGLDLLVSNAGVLTAGSVFELTKDDFDFVTHVNYTGYFLCTKHAARAMAAQNRHASGYLTDIIEINSKSGLEGSNKNFAYAGSKFGGIGLTQSFAMELIEHGIKVNAVCPGNFLDGPLWADPEKGLFRQYLDTGKVAGAKSIADVRKYYEERVPMKRGCEIADVARAIFYIVEQQYETGQALPVTGGQVMLK